MYLKRYKELEILSLYTGNYQKQFYLREISKQTLLPLKTVQNALQRLEQEKILRSSLQGKNKYFTLNRNNVHTKLSILQAEIYKTFFFLNAYPQCKPFLKKIKGDVPLIVFGSFAQGRARKTSDIDLLIISGKDYPLPTHLLPHKVHALRLPERSFIKALASEEAIIKEIEEHHIILNNHSWFVNTLWDHYGQ